MQTLESFLPLISVVVCTYNRADLLKDVLQTLCEQTLEKSGYEIIIIDNNSSDNTMAVAEKFCNHYGNIRYCVETKQGLSHARNRGWQEAQGEYVAYVDDDCKVPRQWLNIAKEIIQRVSPIAFGGPIRTFYNTKLRWFKDSYCSSHQPFDKAHFLRNYHECTRIFGGNAFFRRSILQKLGGFDVRLGMSGKKISYGEESALLRKISDNLANEPIYYDPRLYVYHLFPVEKMTLRYCIHASFGAGRSSFRVNLYNSPRRSRRHRLLIQFIRTSLAIAFHVVRSMTYRDRKQYPYFQNYLYEHTLGYVRNLGKLYEQYKTI